MTIPQAAFFAPVSAKPTPSPRASGPPGGSGFERAFAASGTEGSPPKDNGALSEEQRKGPDRSGTKSDDAAQAPNAERQGQVDNPPTPLPAPVPAETASIVFAADVTPVPTPASPLNEPSPDPTGLPLRDGSPGQTPDVAALLVPVPPAPSQAAALTKAATSVTTTLHAPSLKPAVVTTAAIVPVATNPQPTHADTALLTQASPNAADAATTVVAAPVARTGQASSLPLMSALGQPQEIAGRSGSTETTDALVKARSAPAPQRHSPEVTQGPSQPVGPPAPPTVPQTKGEEPTATPEADIEISQAGREGAFRTETTTPTPPTPSAAPPPTQLAAGEARVPVAEVPTDTLVAEVAGIDPLRSERPSAPTQPPNPGLLAQPETARSVAAQVADVVRAGREGTVEVTLRPEELGRVSLSFNTDGGALTVSLTADRPETLDLLRRNISLLEQELRQLGYDSLDFAFSDGSARGNDAGSRETSGTATSDQADTTQPDARTTEVLRHTSSGGMDLRL